MAKKIKIDGMNIEFEPGQSKEAREAELYRSEKGIDAISLAESAGSKEEKLLRERELVLALGHKPTGEIKAKKSSGFAELRENLEEFKREIQSLEKQHGISLSERTREIDDLLIDLKESDIEDQFANSEYYRTDAKSAKERWEQLHR